jgi:hypothetical protein
MNRVFLIVAVAISSGFSTGLVSAQQSPIQLAKESI